MSDKKRDTKKDEKHSKKKGESSKPRKDEKLSAKKDEKPKLEQVHELGKGKVDRFNQLVKDNKAAGKSWYRGLEGKWWWGMSENDVRTRLVEVEQILGSIQSAGTNANVVATEENKHEANITINEENAVADKENKPGANVATEESKPEANVATEESKPEANVATEESKPEANVVTEESKTEKKE
jgi:hypothetical protein